MFDPIGGVVRLKNIKTKRAIYLNAKDIEITANIVMRQLELGIFPNVAVQADYLRGHQFVFAELVRTDDQSHRRDVLIEAHAIDARMYTEPTRDDIELVGVVNDATNKKSELERLRKIMHHINCPKCGKSIPSWKIGVHKCKVETEKRRETVYRYA